MVGKISSSVFGLPIVGELLISMLLGCGTLYACMQFTSYRDLMLEDARVSREYKNWERNVMADVNAKRARASAGHRVHCGGDEFDPLSPIVSHRSPSR